MRKVLIVDDEASIRNGLPLIIDWERLGYQIVGSAENGEAGLAMIRGLKCRREPERRKKNIAGA